MNKKIEEIKEMNLSEMLFNRDCKLLDYITNLQQNYEGVIKQRNDILQNATETIEKLLVDKKNLQQENKRLTNLCVGHEKELRTKDIIIKQIRMEANDYKSRCEKALYLIKHNDIYDYRVFEENLKNILNGDD